MITVTGPFKLDWENVVALVTGIWALGVGLRLTYELVANEWFTIVGILWFDWVPLLALGTVTTAIFLNRVRRDVFGREPRKHVLREAGGRES
ncbi:hypothetical protein AKJ57_05460 [candidate division MSBL1 archaeon SCGC-AAA259A05]|uniref:Uncharacterized protein n=1 Tax=candidate division MSBL1 archaeon SCGC-AAA259A05 TaxID=1698259 RepID=A0A133U561_9EURY|nr:hypothetical protein AKJ57_05460 [candidate division MSBL1 archaeon SCGC-AAA259A05]